MSIPKPKFKIDDRLHTGYGHGTVVDVRIHVRYEYLIENDDDRTRCWRDEDYMKKIRKTKKKAKK